MEENLKAGTIVDDRYEVVDCIGGGGMGTVYKAWEGELARTVALKMLSPNHASDAEALARFAREAKAISSLSHRNIAVVYRFGVWRGNRPFIAMEYLEGRSLRQVIDERQRLSPDRALRILIQVCEGLAHAHSRGIVHRDLKPHNIMVLPAGTDEVAKIVDFGLATVNATDIAADPKLTATGMLIGSVHYMSPEQCMGKKADQRADLYSVGCVLYECIAGRTPFVADNSIVLLHKHLNEQPRLLSEAAGDRLIAGLDLVTAKALAKDADQRYQSASALAGDLKRVAQGQGDAIEATGVVGLSSRRSLGPRSLVLVVMVCCLIAGCFVAALNLDRSMAEVVGFGLALTKQSSLTNRMEWARRLRAIGRPGAGLCLLEDQANHPVLTGANALQIPARERLEVADAFTLCAELQMESTPDRADRAFLNALTIAEKELRTNPHGSKRDARLAAIGDRLAVVRSKIREPSRGANKRSAREAFESVAKLFSAKHQTQTAERMVRSVLESGTLSSSLESAMLCELGIIQESSRDYKGAMESYDRAISIGRANRSHCMTELTNSMYLKSRLLRKRGQGDEAEGLLEEIHRFPIDSFETYWRWSESALLLAQMRYRQGRFSDAEKLMRESFARLPCKAPTESSYEWIIRRMYLAAMYLSLGREQDARQLIEATSRQAIPILDLTLGTGKGHFDNYSPHHSLDMRARLAEALAMVGDFDAAYQQARAAIKYYKLVDRRNGWKELVGESQVYFTVLDLLTGLQLRKGDLVAARATLQSWSRESEKNDNSLALAESALLYREGKTERALSLLREVFHEISSADSGTSEMKVRYYLLMADVAQRQSRGAEAAKYRALARDVDGAGSSVYQSRLWNIKP